MFVIAIRNSTELSDYYGLVKIMMSGLQEFLYGKIRVSNCKVQLLIMLALASVGLHLILICRLT